LSQNVVAFYLFESMVSSWFRVGSAILIPYLILFYFILFYFILFYYFIIESLEPIGKA